MFYAETYDGETMRSQILHLKKAMSKGTYFYFNAACFCMYCMKRVQFRWNIISFKNMHNSFACYLKL